MKLTKNFWLQEFTKSNTATRLGIDNTPDAEVIDNLKNLCENVLQPVRDHFEEVVSVSSGYRSKALNKAVGGSITSDHVKGFAADFEIYGIDNYKVAKYIQDNLEFDQLILEYYVDGNINSGWLHCSYVGGKGRVNRKQVLKAYKKNGKTVYEPVKL